MNVMKSSLFAKALIKFISGLIITIILIFIPAGSVRFLNGWIFTALLFVPMFIVGIILLIKNPTLLEKKT